MLSVFLLATSCATEEKITTFNNTPETTITSHVTGTEFYEGYPIIFIAAVSDGNHSTETLLVSWRADDRVLCSDQTPSIDGIVSCETSLQEGESVLIVQVADPEGESGTASIDFMVLPSASPEASILSPISIDRYYSDMLILFSGKINDEEDLVTELTYTWTSSIDGILPTNALPNEEGDIEEYFNLTEGEHALTLAVEDLSGKTASASTTILVGGPNSNPECGVVSPLSGDRFITGETINFFANAVDSELQGSDLNIMWRSDKDGELGAGLIDTNGQVSFSSSSLSSNTHNILFEVKDELEGVCSDTITISVGTPPELSITSPLDGDIFTVSSPVSFQGILYDNEEVPSGILLSWFSDIDGEFSMQSANSNGNISLSTSILSSGVHNITITATDSIGLVDSTTFSIRINALPTSPTVVLSPDPANTGDDILAIASASTDSDGQNVSYSYSWYQNGLAVSNSGANLDSSFTTKGELWAVRVTPNDGYQDGNYTESMIIIANAEPRVDSLSITPAVPNTLDVLTCNAGTIEEDGDPLTETYIWTNSTTGASLSSSSTLELSADIVSPGDTITCNYGVTDGDDSDSATTYVVVTNTGPIVEQVYVTPSTAIIGDILTCTIEVDDPDVQGYTESFVWTNVTTGATLGTSSSITISDVMASPTDEIMCSATAIDPSGASGSGSGSVFLDNQLPSVDNITFSSTAPLLGETVECIAVVSDLDGDAITSTFEWTDENGIVVGSDSELFLDSTNFTSGVQITCTVSLTDPWGGAASDSAVVSIVNSSPEISSVSINNMTPQSNDVLVCSVIATDLDGDALSESYIWVNESTATTLGVNPTMTLSPLFVQPGDSIRCDANVNDGTVDSSDSIYVTIMNTDPIVTALEVAPSEPYMDEVISCIATIDEPDLEVTTQVYQWVNTTEGTIISSSDSFVLTDTFASPYDELSCSISVEDTSGGTISDSISVTVGNLNPSIDSLFIDASSVSLGETIECIATASDPEGDTPILGYQWENSTQGTTIGTSASLLVTSSMATGGDTLQCTVTATDDYGVMAEQSTEITVDGSQPVWDTAAYIIPSTSILTTTTLTCSGTALDPDGGAVSIVYVWTNDSQSTILGSSPSLSLDPSSVAPTDVVSCSLTATDSNGEEAVSSASVSVVNSFPSLSNISISPSSVIDSSSTLTCSAVLTDTDEEGLSIDYEWMVNSTTIGTGDTLTLTSSLVQPGDTIVCSATVEDNYGASDSLQESVTISNTAPAISSVAITPDPSYNDGSLECSVVATDADGESLSESYSWTNSTLSTTLGMGSSLSLSSSSASRNDVITCTVTVTDASGDTATETSDLTLTNRAPNSPTVSLSPDPAYVDSTLTCTATATDMDGDSVSYSYAWEIDGVPLSDTTSTLSTAFAAGEFVRCTVTPSDGLLDGSSDSSSLTISNRTPTVDSVSLSPDPLYTDSNIVATASASDLDGDTLSLNYDWYVESVLVQSGVAVSLDFSNYEKDDVVRVEVTADDSAGISTSSSVSITVQNTSPGSPSISISPSEPVAQSDDLVCSVDTASSDVDSDTVTYSFAWTVDSVDYTSATDTETTSTIPASETSTSEEWECTVIPNDGDENGSSTSTSVIMEASGVYAFGETRPPLSCGDFIYNGNNYQQYCFTLKSQTLCIGQTSGGSYSCSDTTDGIQMIFDYSSSWPLRFTANTPSCQNYHPDYIQHLAWALGYENYTIDVTKTGNSCTRTYIDSSGYFQSTGGDSGQAQIYDISFY